MHATSRRCGVSRFLTVVLFSLVTRVTAQAQEAPKVVMAPAALARIALDFDEGRNLIYCFYGETGGAVPWVRIDSAVTVATPAACDGIGIGFINRIGDRAFTLAQLRAFAEANRGLSVVSAFYATEDIMVDGKRIRGARALSVLRPAAAATTVAGRRV